MPEKKQENHKWYNRAIVSQDDIPDLEHGAALYEFEHGHKREDAEEKSYQDYKRKTHSAAAAHHLRGLKAAQEAGDLDECEKHGVAYSLHMQHLGHDSMDKVPEDIQKLVDDEKKPNVYKFKSHKADHLLMGS